MAKCENTSIPDDCEGLFRFPGYFPMVRSTMDGKVRVMIIPPVEIRVSPMWVVLTRWNALRWALAIATTALFRRYPEHLIDPNKKDS